MAFTLEILEAAADRGTAEAERIIREREWMRRTAEALERIELLLIEALKSR